MRIFVECTLKRKVIEQGDRQALLTLVSQFKYDINLPVNEEGETLLHLACKAGYLDVIQTLIEVFDCNVNVVDGHQNMPCFLACAHGHLKVLDYFRHCPFSLKFMANNANGDTLLHAACMSGSLAVVRWVIMAGLNQDKIKLNMYNDEVFSYIHQQESNRSKRKYEIPFNDFGLSPLHSACSKNFCEVIKFFFIEFCQFFELELLPLVPSLQKMAYNLGHVDILKYLSTVFESENNCHSTSDNIIRSPQLSSSTYTSISSTGINGFSSTFLSKTEPILFYVIRCGDTKYHYYRDLCGFGDITIRNNNGDTLLHAACISGVFNIVKDIYELLMNDLSVNNGFIMTKNHMGNTCLHLACEWGLTEIAKFLISKGFSALEKNELNQTPLHIAVLYNRYDIFHYLLTSNNADVNEKNVFGETPLHIATSNYELMKFAEDILSHTKFDKRTLDAADNFGETPMFNAFRLPESRNNMIRILKGSNLCLNNKKNETLAYIAGRLKDLELLDMVLSQESYPDENQNELKQTLLQVILSLQDLSIAQYINVNSAEKYVYKIKNDINLVDSFTDLTPLQSAYYQNNIKVFKFLLTVHGCYLDAQNLKDNNTLLHLVCSNYNEELAEECIEKCTVTIINRMGNTPLHLAAINKEFNLLTRLLEKVTEDISDRRNEEGNNLLHIVAAFENGESILRLLLSKKINKSSIKK